MITTPRLDPRSARQYRDAGFWQDRLITDCLDEAAGRKPQKVAAIDARRTITYAALKEEVDACARALLALGVISGDVVAFQLPNWIEWLVVHYAASRIGAVSNPLVPIYRERELSRMLDLGQAKVLVVPAVFRGFDHGRLAVFLRDTLPALEHVVVVGDPAPGSMAWERCLTEGEHHAVDLAPWRPAADAITQLMFTSGTTGNPKGVLHTHNTLMAATAPWPAWLGLDEHAVLHMASTFAHQTGFLYGARLATQLGTTGVYQEHWDVREFIALVERHGITMTMGATPYLYDTVHAQQETPHDLATLRRFICGGAAIPRSLVRQARTTLSQTAVLSAWGQTENGVVTMCHPDDPEEKIATTDGRPLPGMAIRVVSQGSNVVSAGREGRLQCAGPSVFVGYLGPPELTASCFDGPWFDTGDMAILDEDGYVRITGRKGDMIIRGGENISVAYVEDMLHEHPAVVTAAVVGLPDPRLGERACAFVVLKPGASLDLATMQDFMNRQGLARPYWPERLEIVSELPRTASGKIQKYRLRQRLQDDQLDATHNQQPDTASYQEKSS